MKTYTITEEQRNIYAEQLDADGLWKYAAELRSLTPNSWKPVANNDEVICPNCCNQFRAIPVNVQQLLLDAGFEPPFTAPSTGLQPIADYLAIEQLNAKVMRQQAVLKLAMECLDDAGKGYQAMGWGMQRIDSAIAEIKKELK